MALRMERVESLANELFLLQTCGDDRAVVETYVMGRPMKSSLAGDRAFAESHPSGGTG
jgi:guanine deaminase